MHAKLTRDRKKLFTSRMQQMISSLERQNGMMKNRLKSLATVGEIPMTHDRNRERMRDNRENSISVLLGHQKSSNSTVPSNQQYPSGFPMSVLQALSSSNPNEINTADQISNPVLSLAQTQVLSLSQVADLNTDAHNMNRYKPFSHGCRDQASVANDPNPFLQHLGSLDRTIQTDSNLILHQLGPLSRIRTDPRQLMAPSSNSSSQFTSSSSRSFFEAL